MVEIDAGTISGSALTVEGKVPGIDAAKFEELAQKAKANCPVSKALGAINVTLDAKLVARRSAELLPPAQPMAVGTTALSCEHWRHSAVIEPDSAIPADSMEIEMTIKVTFPDGAVRDYARGTTGTTVVEGISTSLAKKTVAMKWNGVLTDLSDPLERRRHDRIRRCATAPMASA